MEEKLDKEFTEKQRRRRRSWKGIVDRRWEGEAKGFEDDISTRSMTDNVSTKAD